MANAQVLVNTGIVDRIIRLIVGLVLIIWPTLAAWETWTTTILAAIGGALVIMGLTGHCGIYRLLGISTAGNRNNATARS